MKQAKLKTRTRYVSVLLLGSVLLAGLFGVPRVAAAGTVTGLSASYSTGTVSVTGTASEGTHAVAVLVYGGETLLRLETAGVSAGAFTASISMELPAGTYTVKAADYEGGEFQETTFTVAAVTPPVDPPSDPPSDPGGSTGTTPSTPATQPVTHTEKTTQGNVTTETVTTTLTDESGNEVTRVAKTSTDATTNESAFNASIVTSGASAAISPDILESAQAADAASVTVMTQEGGITFDKSALEGMALESGGEDLTLSLERRDESSLPAEVRAAAGDSVVFELSIKSASEEIIEFRGTVTVSIAVPDGFLGKNVQLYHIAADGTAVLIEGILVLRDGIRYFEFSTDHFSFYALEPVETLPFADVAQADWWFEGIYYVCARGLFYGTTNTTFAPEESMTRAMLTTVLHRMDGMPTPAAGNSFSDVRSGEWYTDAIDWASANGIVTGYPDGRFGVEDHVTREQMAAILYRYAKHKGHELAGAANLDGYTDAKDTSDWALDAMKWANAEGLLTGTTATTLSPRGRATRAQVAAVLMRFLENAAK